MGNVPFSWEQMNIQAYHHSPSGIRCANTGLTAFFSKKLFEEFKSVYKWEGLPETWPENYFTWTLYLNGVVGVIDTPDYGVIPQQCSLFGYNVFYLPNQITIANRYISKATYDLGVDAEIIRFQDDYSGIAPLISYYANLMALAAEDLASNLVNTKFAYVFAAGNKSGAEALKKMFDTIASGQPAAVLDKELYNDDGSPSWELFCQNLKQNFLGLDLLDTLQSIMDNFCADVGIPNVSIRKKERTTVDEINMNNVQTFAKATRWLETMQDCCRRVNAMFGTNINVDFRFKQEGGAEDASGESDPERDV